MDELNETSWSPAAWLASLWPVLPLLVLLLGERGRSLLVFRFVFRSMFVLWCAIGLVFAVMMYQRKHKRWHIVLMANLIGLAFYTTIRFGDVTSL